MEIREQISAIIARRQARLPGIDEKLRVLDEMEAQAARVEAVRNQMIRPDGTVISESKFAPMLERNPDMAWGLQALDFEPVKDGIKRAREALGEYRRRCARETVDISVVGKARGGKSELLKSISGLSNHVIPAFDSTDCTGAPSVIHNVPGSSLQARLRFKSSGDMLAAARTYLERMIADVSQRPALYRMEDIRSLDLAAVEAAVPAGAAEGILFEYLKKMADHYDEWAPYADGPEMVLTDENKIMEFVAQNNGVSEDDPTQTREDYYKYLVVDTCEISCAFPQADAGRISLIDTVGLGDHTEGILDKMLETVGNRSDAVIFLHLPRDGTGGGLPAEVVNIYNSIREKCGDRALDQWLFYFINHVAAPTKSLAVNTAYCEGALKRIKGSKWLGAQNAKIVEVTDAEAVRNQFLMPLLESLLKNLDSIDETYRRPAAEALEALGEEYGALCGRAEKVLRSDVRANASLAPLVHRLTEEAMKNLRAVLFRTQRAWREKRDQPCAVLDSSARDIFTRMCQTNFQGAYLPTQKEIMDELESGIIPNLLYTQYANAIRNRISKDFLNVDLELQGVIAEMKGDMARALYDSCGLSALCPPPEGDRPAYEWFRDFADTVLGDDYPNLRLAVETLAGFEFSVKGFLTYEVRNCLDDLDLNFGDVPRLVNEKNSSLERTRNNICANLHRTLCRIANILEDEMGALCVKPNRAMFAEIADFCDRIFYAGEAEMEWRNFYANYASLLWSEELRQQQSVGVMFQDWLELAEGLRQYLRSHVFSL